MGYQYEFSEIENQTIGHTGGKARTWGVLALISGGLCLVLLGVGLYFTQATDLIPGNAANMISSILVTTLLPLGFVNLVMGNFYIKAGQALANVVDTQGNDIDHMLEGLSMMRNAFRVEVLVSIVIFVLSFGAGFMLATNGLG